MQDDRTLLDNGLVEASAPQELTLLLWSDVKGNIALKEAVARHVLNHPHLFSVRAWRAWVASWAQAGQSSTSAGSYASASLLSDRACAAPS